jgi:hypothetical protein
MVGATSVQGRTQSGGGTFHAICSAGPARVGTIGPIGSTMHRALLAVVGAYYMQCIYYHKIVQLTYYWGYILRISYCNVYITILVGDINCTPKYLN